MGRCTPTLSHVFPGQPPNDKILIFEDTNGDGKADTCKVFARSLVSAAGNRARFRQGVRQRAAEPVVLEDTRWRRQGRHERTDLARLRLGRFAPRLPCALYLGSGHGALYFQEGTSSHANRNALRPRRSHNAACIASSRALRSFDDSFRTVLPIRGGTTSTAGDRTSSPMPRAAANYYARRVLRRRRLSRQAHGNMQQFLTKQWRPTSGCELVSSRNFPDDVAGRFPAEQRDRLSGHAAATNCTTKVPACKPHGFRSTRSSRCSSAATPTSRPVDLEFGPDGALYICRLVQSADRPHAAFDSRPQSRPHAWPHLAGHYARQPLVKPAKIAGEPLDKLLDCFKTEPKTARAIGCELN